MTGTGSGMDVERILSETEDYKCVSFDVYDTLLVRPYVKPTDLFRHIEKAFDATGFAVERERAEKASRDKSGETTYDRIYETIDPIYRHLKDIELEFESRVYCPPDVRECFNALCKRQRVILISDMYFPSAFIESLLKKCGLEGYDHLYVSCEFDCGKHSGKLFQSALFHQRLWFNEVVHIGDNYRSDYLIPRFLGIHVIRVRRPIDEYLKNNRRIRRYYRTCPSVERSMLVSLDMIHSLENGSKDFWYDVSYRFGGPLAMDYVNFIERNIDPRESLFFVARDGYNLKKIFDMRVPNNGSEYIYAPRLLNILIGSHFERYRGYQEVLVGHFFPEFKGDPYEFYEENRDSIMELRKELFNAYSSTMGKHRDVCVVDVTTMKYSSQELITDLCPNTNIRGMYYFILNDEPDVPHSGYHVRDKTVKLGDNVNITEFFLTSPEPPVEGIGPDGKPVFKDICADEKQRLDIYGSVTQGELDYCRDIDRMFGDERIEFGYRNIRDWLKVLTNPLDSYSRAHLAEMKWPVDAKHEMYIGMVYHPRDTWYHLIKTVLDSKMYVSKRLKMR